MSDLDQAVTQHVGSIVANALLPAPLPAVPRVSRLTLDLLEWIASRPRTYTETMEAWRTNCPGFPIWEDAVDDGLVWVESQSGTPMDQTRVLLTAHGRAILDSQ